MNTIRYKRVQKEFLSNKSVDIWERLFYIIIVPEREQKGGTRMNVNLKRLKAERIANGITQDEMSSLMGWRSRTPYAKRELGIVPLGANELAKAAEILGYGTDSLGIFFTVNVPEKERKQPA